MSFTGNLEHLPIVDIVQLLHQTRKTGTLSLRSAKGESHLVFKDGYIVSANHHNNNIRIGRILVEMGVVGEDVIEKAIRQQGTGPERKPLVAILVEQGYVPKESAFKGLETLIELTIVEILTWNEGTFTLDISTDVVSDEYRYFPEKLHEELVLDTQNVLMDALRIYDERNRDGVVVQEEWLNDDFSFGESVGEPPASSEEEIISLEVLGLDELDMVEKKIPEVFSSLREEESADVHRQIVSHSLSGASEPEREHVAAYLKRVADESENVAGSSGTTAILFSRDKLFQHAVVNAARQHGHAVFTTDDPDNLTLLITQAMSKKRLPVLVLDRPETKGAVGIPAATIASVSTAVMKKHPTLDVIRIVEAADSPSWVNLLGEGVRAVFPKPSVADHQSYAAEIVPLVESLVSYLSRMRQGQVGGPLVLLQGYLREMGGLTKASDIALVLLKLCGSMFERSLTLVVNGSELVSERSLGIKSSRDAGPSTTVKFSIPLTSPSVFRDVIESGQRYWGVVDDDIVREHLFWHIGMPKEPQILLLPLKCFGRTIAIVYADFGTRPPSPVETPLAEIASQIGSLILDNALYKSKIDHH